MIQHRDVVCGFILPASDEFRLLCAQRPDDAEHFPSMYEFVGGKVDQGETHHAALIREIKEEMDVEVEILEDKPAFHFNHAPKMDKRSGGQIEFRLFFYWCRLLPNEPEPKALASQKVIWLTPQEMTGLQFCPGDEDIIQAMNDGSLRPACLQ